VRSRRGRTITYQVRLMEEAHNEAEGVVRTMESKEA